MGAAPRHEPRSLLHHGSLSPGETLVSQAGQPYLSSRGRVKGHTWNYCAELAWERGKGNSTFMRTPPLFCTSPTHLSYAILLHPIICSLSFSLAGCNAEGIATDLAEVYDFTTRQWTPLPNIPHRRAACNAAVVHRNKIYLIGGGSTTNSDPSPPSIALISSGDNGTRISQMWGGGGGGGGRL